MEDSSPPPLSSSRHKRKSPTRKDVGTPKNVRTSKKVNLSALLSEESGRKPASSTKKRDKACASFPTLDVTGAMAGDVLIGCHPQWTLNARFQVPPGGVIPTKEQDLQMGRTKNAIPLGAECACDSRAFAECKHLQQSLILLDVGKLFDFAAAAGKGDQLLSLVGKQVTWKDLLPLFGKNTLVLRKQLFYRQPQGSPLQPHTPVIDLRTGLVHPHVQLQTVIQRGEFTLHRLPDDVVMAVPAHGSQVARVQTWEHARKLCADMIGNATLSDRIASQIEKLDGDGILRSLLQKCIRYHARYVALDVTNDTDSREPFYAPTWCVAVVSAARLAVSAGSLSPNIGKFVRGLTSVCKRLGIILVEDAFVSDVLPSKWFAVALVASHSLDWFPTDTLFLELLDTVRLAVESNQAVDSSLWEGVTVRHRVKGLSVDQHPLSNAAHLLSILRSFDGDEIMLEQVAHVAERLQLEKGRGMSITLPMVTCLEEGRPNDMPIYHAVDQHCMPGVAHVWNSSHYSTFAERFHRLFHQCTGLNPRRHHGSAWQSSQVWISEHHIRQVQRVCWILRFRKPPVWQEVPSNTGTGVGTATSHELVYKVQTPLPTGALAAAVGTQLRTIDRKHCAVVLGLREPEKEVIIRIPSRDNKDDQLIVELNQQQRDKVIQGVRDDFASTPRVSKMPPFHLLSDNGRSTGAKITFCAREAKWCVNGIPWADFRAQFQHTVPLLWRDPAVRRRPDVMFLYDIWDAENLGLLSAVQYRAVVPNAMAQLTQLLRRDTRNTPRVIGRALQLMSNEVSTISLPTPDLKGKKCSDQLPAEDFDDDVYWLFMRICVLFPCALQPSTPPRFRIVDGLVLKDVENHLREYIQQFNGDQQRDAWTELTAPAADLQPMQHQLDALQDMIQNDRYSTSKRRGQFIFSPTGAGKSMMAAMYLHHLKQKGELPPFVLWTITHNMAKGKQMTHFRQLLRKHGMPVNEIRSAAEFMGLRRGYVNVMSQDVLKHGKVLPHILELGTALACVFDEVDCQYNETYRTNAALSVASIAPVVIAMTGTALRNKDPHGLLRWLRMIVDFTLDTTNLWVAATAMVAKNVDFGIALEKQVLRFPLPFDPVLLDIVRERRTNWWLQAARMTQAHTDAHLVRVAIEKAVEHGGALVVADTLSHQQKLLQELTMASGRLRVGDEGYGPDPDYSIIVVPRSHDRGYSWAIRLGCMVTGVYADNAAERKQMEGRILRLGQQREKVFQYTVVLTGSILDRLLDAHSQVDMMNATLQSMAEQYSYQELRAAMLGTPHSLAADIRPMIDLNQMDDDIDSDVDDMDDDDDDDSPSKGTNESKSSPEVKWVTG